MKIRKKLNIRKKEATSGILKKRNFLVFET